MDNSTSLLSRGCGSDGERTMDRECTMDDRKHTTGLHPDENWKKYSRCRYLYVNSNDPRIFVMMERGITVNLGRWGGWGSLVLVVLLPVAGVVYVDRCYGTGWAGVFALSFCVVFAVCAYLLAVLGQWLYPGAKGLRPLSGGNATREVAEPGAQ